MQMRKMAGDEEAKAQLSNLGNRKDNWASIHQDRKNKNVLQREHHPV